MITLYQAEWCPYSSAVREVLTELGVDFVARQVEPWPEDRAALRSATGKDQIPTLVTDDGTAHIGTRRVFEYLETLAPGKHAAEHRQRYDEHKPARDDDATRKLLAHFHAEEPGEPVQATPDDAEVVHRPESRRYDLRLDGRAIGHATYDRRGDTMVVLHTEVDRACEGRGFGSKLVEELLVDAGRQNLQVVPLCSFVRAYIRRHPEHESLLVP
jgi:predicted GNAT family acetyltransferase/glutaredoxin